METRNTSQVRCECFANGRVARNRILSARFTEAEYRALESVAWSKGNDTCANGHARHCCTILDPGFGSDGDAHLHRTCRHSDALDGNARTAPARRQDGPGSAQHSLPPSPDNQGREGSGTPRQAQPETGRNSHANRSTMGPQRVHHLAAARLSLHARSVLSRVRCDRILRLPALPIWPAAAPTLLPAVLPAQRDRGPRAFSEQIPDALCFGRRIDRAAPRSKRMCSRDPRRNLAASRLPLDAHPGSRSPWHLLPHARGTAQLSEQDAPRLDCALDLRGCSALQPLQDAAPLWARGVRPAASIFDPQGHRDASSNCATDAASKVQFW